jgi:hypothetical protein
MGAIPYTNTTWIKFGRKCDLLDGDQSFNLIEEPMNLKCPFEQGEELDMYL